MSVDSYYANEESQSPKHQEHCSSNDARPFIGGIPEPMIRVQNARAISTHTLVQCGARCGNQHAGARAGTIGQSASGQNDIRNVLGSIVDYYTRIRLQILSYKI